MCLSVGITFVARKIWPSARWRNMYLCRNACMFAYLHTSVHAGSLPNLREDACVGACVCVCVSARAREGDDGSAVTLPGGSSSRPIVGGEHEARHLFFPEMNYETKPSARYSLRQQRPRPKT